MSKKMFLVLAGFYLSLSLPTMNAADYIVYKVKYKVNEFNKNASGEWRYNKRNDHLKFQGYFVFESNFDTSGDNAPARIILFKSKSKFRPLNSSGQPDTTKPLTKKLIIYPLPAINPLTGKELSVEDNYNGLTDSKADSYYIFGGAWSNVTIENSTQDKNILSMIDYYEDTSVTSSENKEIVDVSCLKGYSEFISGQVKKGEAKRLSGALSYYCSDTIGKSKAIRYKLDSKILPKAEIAVGMIKADTMREAVNAIVGYLAQKKYASTWSE